VRGRIWGSRGSNPVHCALDGYGFMAELQGCDQVCRKIYRAGAERALGRRNIAGPASTALREEAPGSARRLRLEEFGKLRERRIRVQSQSDPGCRFAKGGVDVHHLVDTRSTLQE
jgi:hypothetical protein